jgi:LPS sulfotransferase NodH
MVRLHSALKAASLWARSYASGVHTQYTRFALIGHARTGSNLLLDVFRSSPEVEMFHEIFSADNRVIGKGFNEGISRLYKEYARCICAVGCKIFYNHLTDEEWTEFERLKEFKIIHLMRHNRLRTIVSLAIAFKTDIWLQTNSRKKLPVEQKRVYLNPEKLIGQISQIAAWESETRNRFAHRDTLEIYYEDLIDNFNSIASNAIRFVGAERWSSNKVAYKKQNPEPLNQLIINFDEVNQVLKNTPWEKYLDGELFNHEIKNNDLPIEASEDTADQDYGSTQYRQQRRKPFC